MQFFWTNVGFEILGKFCVFLKNWTFFGLFDLTFGYVFFENRVFWGFLKIRSFFEKFTPFGKNVNFEKNEFMKKFLILGI